MYMHVFIAHCNFAGTWRIVEHQPASRPRSHELVDAGFGHANFPSRFPLLPSCLFTRHLWLKEGGKTAFAKVCPSAALDTKTTSPPTATCTWASSYSAFSCTAATSTKKTCIVLFLFYSFRLLVPIQPTSPSPSTLPTRRESGSGVDKRGCFERPPQQTKDIPWAPNSQPHLLRPRADCNETPSGPHTN